MTALLEGVVATPPREEEEGTTDGEDGPVVFSAASPSAADSRRKNGQEEEEDEVEEEGGLQQRGRRRKLSGTNAERLQGGLEELIAAMPIKDMRRRLEEVGANPRRLGTCLEKVSFSPPHPPSNYAGNPANIHSKPHQTTPLRKYKHGQKNVIVGGTTSKTGTGFSDCFWSTVCYGNI